jgi:hypothetical protein
MAVGFKWRSGVGALNRCAQQNADLRKKSIKENLPPKLPPNHLGRGNTEQDSGWHLMGKNPDFSDDTLLHMTR